MSHINEPDSGVISRHHNCVEVEELYPSHFPPACKLSAAVPAMNNLKQRQLPSIAHKQVFLSILGFLLWHQGHWQLIVLRNLFNFIKVSIV